MAKFEWWDLIFFHKLETEVGHAGKRWKQNRKPEKCKKKIKIKKELY